MSGSALAGAERRSARLRPAAIVGLAVLGLMLVVNLGKLVHLATVALAYPYDLDYGEGIVWQQMRDIVGGRGYRPIGVYPAIVFHYPPIYHLVSAALARIAGLDELLAGRLVSVISTGVMMLATGLLAAGALPARASATVRVAAAGIAGLALASAPMVIAWAPLMRVDMLSCALSLIGLGLAIRGASRPRALVLAALAFVAAIYTKQSAIAAPAAAFLGLLTVRHRAALHLLAMCFALGVAALAILVAITGGGFLRHIVLYNMNRVDLGRWTVLTHALATHLPQIAVALCGVATAWPRLRDFVASRRHRIAEVDGAELSLWIVFLFLVLKTLMLPMILKSGAGANYLIEWLCAVAIFAGIGAAPTLGYALEGAPRPAMVPLILVAFILPLAAALVPDVTPAPDTMRASAARMGALVERIRASTKPVVSDDMVLLIRAGKPVLWEPAIAAELAHGGRYDEPAFARMIRAHAFGFFATRGERGEAMFDARYDPVVAEAIAAALPRTECVGKLVLHLPAR